MDKRRHTANMWTLTGRAALVGAALALAVASPAYAAERNVITISPADVTIGPDNGATQVIHIEGDQSAEISVEFSPSPPMPGVPDITRRNGRCTRHGGATYVCEGWNDVTIRYPTTEATGLEVKLTVRVSDGRAIYGSVTVESPPPPPTSEPAPEPSETQTEPEQEVIPVLPPTSDPPSTTPAPTSAAALPPAEDSGSGLATVALSVGAAGLVGMAGAVVGALSLRRKREALRLQPRGPRPDVAVNGDEALQ